MQYQTNPPEKELQMGIYKGTEMAMRNENIKTYIVEEL
jgi:hypothetical protein